ncbi:MAG: tripartite tricarboxylate transporter substrate binding protein [Betaproteobacteria bacterium]|nr:tripartite tricarboxylate transporter substrate binding protein [Betaproteobacteria bacterium]
MRRLAGCTKGSMSRFAALLLAFVSLGGFAAASVAAPYPERPVKMIVPYPAGGSTDGTARLVAQKLSEMWGQAVVVDNRPGADTQIGNSAVASAAPDGYTLLVIATTFAISKSLYPSLPYDPARDFTPIASVAIAPFYLIVGSGSPAKTVGELIAMARKDPGKLNYAVSSATNFMAAELMKQAAGIDVMPIRYKGGAPAVVAVVTGEVSYGLENPLSVQSMLDAGKMHALAVTGERRSAALPSVPTFAEVGLGTADIGAWVGIAGPRGLPADIVEKINTSVRAVLAMPDVKAKLDSYMATPISLDTAGFVAFIKKEFDRYEAVVKSSKLTAP